MNQILITGGMSGLGKAVALIAHKKGYAVDILDVSRGEMNPGDLGENMRFIQGDITKVNDEMLSKFSKNYDMFICNAGISLSGNFIDHSLQENQKLMHINTLGHMELTRMLLEKDILRSGGNIGCIVSASEMLPFPIALGYSASKGALRAFADSLRAYLIGRKISVTNVYPGPMPTAHVKYYGKEVSHDEKAKKKVHTIAKKVLRGIEKRKRNIYPDMISKTLAYVPIPKFLLDRTMYRAYRKDIS